MKRNLLTCYRNIFYVLIVLAPRLVFATQQPALPGKDSADIREFFLKTQEAYRKSAYLSFGVKYFYSNLEGDGQAMDSMAGAVQMDKDRCHYVIAGNETLFNGHYIIQVQHEDRVIYFAKTSHGIAANPVQMIDSLLAAKQGLNGTVTTAGGFIVLQIILPPGGQYSQVRMEVDPSTWYFRRVTYLLHTEGLVASDMIEKPGHPAPYRKEGRVDVVFSNYQKGRFNESVFDEANFFTQSNGHIQPSLRYKDYHIFLANSNL